MGENTFFGLLSTVCVPSFTLKSQNSSEFPAAGLIEQSCSDILSPNIKTQDSHRQNYFKTGQTHFNVYLNFMSSIVTRLNVTHDISVTHVFAS